MIRDPLGLHAKFLAGHPVALEFLAVDGCLDFHYDGQNHRSTARPLPKKTP